MSQKATCPPLNSRWLLVGATPHTNGSTDPERFCNECLVTRLLEKLTSGIGGRNPGDCFEAGASTVQPSAKSDLLRDILADVPKSNILADVPKSNIWADVLEEDTGRSAVTEESPKPTPRSSIMADGAGGCTRSNDIADCADGDDLEHGRDGGPSCVFFAGAATGGKAPTGEAGRESLDNFASPGLAKLAAGVTGLGLAKLAAGVSGLGGSFGGPMARAWLGTVTSAAAPRARGRSGGSATTAAARRQAERRIGLLVVFARMGFAGLGVVATS